MIFGNYNKMHVRSIGIVLFVFLSIGLTWIYLQKTQPEMFVDVAPPPAKVDIADLPDPQTVFKGLRALLDKYDNPEVLGHITQVMDKDPGQLARMNLRIQN